MNLPKPPKTYDPSDQSKVRELIRRDSEEAFKRGGTIEVAKGRLVLTDTVTGTRYNVTIVSGVLTLTAVAI